MVSKPTKLPLGFSSNELEENWEYISYVIAFLILLLEEARLFLSCVRGKILG